MNSKLKDYLINTTLGQIFFILVLSPWFIFIIGMSFEQYITWLWQGSLIGLVLPHGMIMWVGFWKRRIVQNSRKLSWVFAQVSYTKNISSVITISTLVNLSVNFRVLWWRYLGDSGDILCMIDNIIQYQPLLYRPSVLFLCWHLPKYLLCPRQH